MPARGAGAGHPDGAAERALAAAPPAGVAGVRAPPAARLLQALRARAVARAVLSYETTNQDTKPCDKSLPQTRATKNAESMLELYFYLTKIFLSPNLEIFVLIFTATCSFPSAYLFQNLR